jgi:hypothetical protein
MDRNECKCRSQAQAAEIVGKVNRWYCSQAHKREVTDGNTLTKYFIDSGGAHDFCERWEEAMDEPNRWFCSEYYDQPIGDYLVLWAYFMAKRLGKEPPPLERCRRVLVTIE